MPIRRRRILFPLDEDETVFLRARLDTAAGDVTGFALQLELVEGDRREIVLRFDTAHGYVHQHQFSPGEAERRTRLQFRNWAEAYTYCYEYIRRNWEPAIDRFIRRRG